MPDNIKDNKVEKRETDSMDSVQYQERNDGWKIEKTLRIDILIVLMGMIGIIITMTGVYWKLEGKVNEVQLTLTRYISEQEKFDKLQQSYYELKFQSLSERIKDNKNAIKK